MGGKGITVAGSLIADMYYIVDSYPEQGKLTHIRNTDRAVGGTGNLIQDLARLDKNLTVKVSAIIGTGSNGRYIKNTLQAYENIDLTNLVEEGESSVTIVMDALDNHQRTFFYLPAASDAYDEKVIDWNAVAADIFHLEYILLMKSVDAPDEEFGTHGAKILHDARKRGMKTSIDMVSETTGRGGEIVKAALPYTDYCTINEIEAEMITGIKLWQEDGNVDQQKVSAALEQIASYGVSTWVVIHAPQVGYGMDCTTGRVIKVDSLHLPDGFIKGSTGAGDAYCSGILYGAYKGMTLEESMKLGAATAACSLSEVSGTAGVCSYEKVMKIYEAFRN